MHGGIKLTERLKKSFGRILVPKDKISHQGSEAYLYEYRNIEFLVQSWDIGMGKTKRYEWYLFTIEKNDYRFTEREMDMKFKTRNEALNWMVYLIDKYLNKGIDI